MYVSSEQLSEAYWRKLLPSASDLRRFSFRGVVSNNAGSYGCTSAREAAAIAYVCCRLSDKITAFGEMVAAPGFLSAAFRCLSPACCLSFLVSCLLPSPFLVSCFYSTVPGKKKRAVWAF